MDDDLAWCLERAGRVALTAGEAALARVPLALALEQWRALARADKASAVEALLDQTA